MNKNKYNMLPLLYNQNKFPLVRGNNYRIADIKKTKYGYSIKRMSDFVSIQNIKLHILDNGFSYAIVKVSTNYRTPYQYRLYFDNEGYEITVLSNSDISEKKAWLLWQENLI